MRTTLRSLLRDRAVMETLMQDREALLRDLETVSGLTLEVARPADLVPQLDAILEGHPLDAAGEQGLSALEAIVLLRGRPVLLVQQDRWQQPASEEIRRWLGNPADAGNRLRPRLPSVGRIEIVGDDDQDYIGTGWMLDRDVMITNRHVAEAFGVKRGSGFGFRRRPDGGEMAVRADFKREHLRQEMLHVGVREMIYIAPPGDVFPDMALLRLDRAAVDLPEPIALDDGPLVTNDPANLPTLAVVGYPAEDARNDATAMRQIFDGIYRVKRLSPGRVMTVAPNGRVLEHDCTTLGGNSGSPVINLSTGRACGLHFAGTYRSRNFAVTSGWLKAQLAELETRRIFLPAGADGDQLPEEAPPRIRAPGYFEGREGYKSGFLGDHVDLRVPLPNIDAALQDRLVEGDDLVGGELKYCHFSVKMRRDRRLPFYTAVNIDGGKLYNLPRGRDSWYLDGRLDAALQLGESLYAGNPLDRGHLVRRLDPTWGDTREEARLAEEDTFHFTNCAPQHAQLNQRTWLSLEDYILGNANTRDFKASVFSGPVMAETDRPYRDSLLPQEYWKVAVMVNEATGALSATGYLLSQSGLVQGLEFVFGPYKTYQVPLSLIEAKTGLHFDLSLYDPLAGTEGTPVREVEGPQDLVL